MNHIRERSSAGSHAAPVGPVEEAVVRAHAALDAGHPGDVRVAPVGGDDEPPAQRAARAVAILDHDAAAAVAVAQQLGRRAAGQQLDARRLGGHAAQERIEDLARDVVAVRRVARGGGSSRHRASTGRSSCAPRRAPRSAPRGPAARSSASRWAGCSACRRSCRRRGPGASRRARRARRAARTGAPPCSRRRSRRRRRRRSRARSSARRLSIRACRRCRRTIARSARLPGGGAMASWRARSLTS